MEISVARSAGFCYGVKRAIEIVEKALEDQQTPISSLGSIIHNPQVVSHMAQKGLKLASRIEEIPAGRVVISSHGVGPFIYQQAAKRNLEVIDATCPFVKNVHNLARQMQNEGYQVVVFGDREHVEVQGVLETVAKKALVLSFDEPVDPTAFQDQKIAIISQTTQQVEKFQQFVVKILPWAKEVRVFNTICSATSERQQEADELSREVELMLIIGGKNSANTFRLFEICRRNGTTAYQIEAPEEIQPQWLQGITKVGITAGASTPVKHIDEAVFKIMNIGGTAKMDDLTLQNEAIPNDEEGKKMENESFDELLKQDWEQETALNFRPGDIIEAKVILVRDDVAFVDIGGKSDFTITLEELSVQPALSAKEVVQEGETIRVMVVKAKDSEKIQLSRRRVEQRQVWLDLETAFNAKTPVQVRVTASVKGGLSLDLNGIRAFMPASQASINYISDLGAFVGQELTVRIIEFEQAKRRVVVSRRVIEEELKQQAEAEFFSQIKEGQRCQGKVTRLTNFGAFVDLGSGIEGLLHISELSWYRVKTPAEVLQAGDEIEVLVIKCDPATKKISLSLRQIQNHPWDTAIINFREGAVYPGTVVKLEAFGAFVRLTEGVDGLVHVSQISERRIGKPDEVLNLNDEVNAKVLKIDHQNRKISLSLKEVAVDKSQNEVENYLNQQNQTEITQNLGSLIDFKEGEK